MTRYLLLCPSTQKGRLVPHRQDVSKVDPAGRRQQSGLSKHRRAMQRSCYKGVSVHTALLSAALPRRTTSACTRYAVHHLLHQSSRGKRHAREATCRWKSGVNVACILRQPLQDRSRARRKIRSVTSHSTFHTSQSKCTTRSTTT